MGFSSTPEEFMKGYELRANSKNFESIGPLINEKAIYWFSDGSYIGIEQIRKAFEKTWSTIKDEIYTLKNLNWISKCAHSAICVYDFNSTGIVNGRRLELNGRGTNVLTRGPKGEWQILHEHLSRTR